MLSQLSHVWSFVTPWTVDPTTSFSPWGFSSKPTGVEWVAISSSRGSSQPRDQTLITCIFCISNWILYQWATWHDHEESSRIITFYNSYTFYFMRAHNIMHIYTFVNSFMYRSFVRLFCLNRTLKILGTFDVMPLSFAHRKYSWAWTQLMDSTQCFSWLEMVTRDKICHIWYAHSIR